VTPAPRRNARRGMCFLVINILLRSLFYPILPLALKPNHPIGTG
jgi:hypothetical protein